MSEIKEIDLRLYDPDLRLTDIDKEDALRLYSRLCLMGAKVVSTVFVHDNLPIGFFVTFNDNANRELIPGPQGVIKSDGSVEINMNAISFYKTKIETG